MKFDGILQNNGKFDLRNLEKLEVKLNDTDLNFQLWIQNVRLNFETIPNFHKTCYCGSYKLNV